MTLELAVSHKLTLQQQAFVELVSSGRDTSEAVVEAGYNVEVPHKEAWRLLHQPAILAAIQINVARQLATGAPVSLRLLQDCVKNERVDMRLRVACAKDLLNRAGYVPPKAVAPGRAGETPLNEMSMGELRTLADKLEGEIAGRAKEVSSAKAAPARTQTIEDIM